MFATEAAKSSKNMWRQKSKSTTRLRNGVMLLGALGLALLFAACGANSSQATQSLIKAKRIEIVDDSGATRMVLTAENGKPTLTLADSSGTLRALLFLGDTGTPSLVLVDNPRIALMDQTGEIRLAERLDITGTPFTTQMDSGGKVRTMLTLDASGAPTLEMYDDRGSPILKAPTTGGQ